MPPPTTSNQQTERLSSWVLMNFKNWPNSSSTTEISTSEGSDNDASSKQEGPPTPQPEDAKHSINGVVKGQAKENLSSWVVWNFKNRPNLEAQKASRQRDGAIAPQQENQKPLVDVTPVEQAEEGTSSGPTTNPIHRSNSPHTSTTCKPSNLEDSSFSELNEYAVSPHQYNKSPSVDDTAVNQAQEREGHPSQSHEPVSLPPSLAQYAARATPLAQQDLEIFARIGNAREQPLAEAEAGLDDAETEGPDIDGEKASQNPKPQGEKREVVKGWETQQDTDHQGLSSPTGSPQRKGVKEWYSQQLAAQPSRTSAENARVEPFGTNPHQKSRSRKRSSHQADFSHAETFPSESPEQKTPSTNHARNSKKRSKRRRHERALKPSPLQTESLHISSLQTETLVIGYGSPPPPLPLSTLSLSERWLFSRVRQHILSLPEPEYNGCRFLVRNPQWTDHPLYCDAERLADVYGFVEPGFEERRQLLEEAGGEADDEEESGGANNKFAKTIIALCELQEHLAGYEIRYPSRSQGPESRPVSPRTVERYTTDWAMKQVEIQGVQVELPAEEYTNIDLDDLAPSWTPVKNRRRETSWKQRTPKAGNALK
ncbi:hypothetical protein MMC30_006927 [Trapelia coarctata]|nr:hypothetical protein [Trapelia coarctata]